MSEAVRMYALAKRLRAAAESFEGQRAWHANAVDGDCEPHDSWQVEMEDGSRAAIEAACLIERLACSIAIDPYTSAISVPSTHLGAPDAS